MIRPPTPRPASRIRAAQLAMAATLICWTVLGRAEAQSPQASIRGTVLDPGGQAVSGARVELVHDATGERRQAVTGGGGAFALVSVAPGRQRLHVSHDGFKTHMAELVLRVGEEQRSEIVLEVGQLADIVHVTAPDLDLRQASSALGAQVGLRELASLPLDGRNFLELSLLTPGVVPPAQGAAATVRGDFASVINGGRDDANGYLLDGADNVDPKLNTPAVRPPVDAIHEFEVLSSTPDASVGRYGAGHVNVILKSGTNEASGTAYGFFRNAALESRNVFARALPTAPEYERGQFGTWLGGPIAQNRVFYFVDYEGTRTREGLTRITTVPTAAERAGDFSQSLATPINPFTGQPFPGNRIPEFFMHPVGRRIAELYPLPNRPGTAGNYVASPTARDAVDHVDGKLTAQLGASTLFARYSINDRRLLEPYAGGSFSAIPGFGNDVDRRGQNFVAGETRVLSPQLVNEARVSFTRVSAAVSPEHGGRNINAAVGLPTLSANPRDAGLSFITISGFSALGDEYNNPQAGTTNAFHAADTLSWSRSRHLIKTGFDVLALRQEAFRDVQARGQLAFTDFAYTRSALGDLLLGLPSFTLGAHLDNPQRLRTESYGVFLQDSVTLRPDLTLNVGLRYELISPPVDADDRASLYDVRTGRIVPVGQNGMPRGGHDTDTNNIAPRVGLVWSLPAAATTVLRAGYGRYYSRAALAPSEGLYFNSPYYDLNFYVPFEGLPISLSDPFPATYPVSFPDSALAIDPEMVTPSWDQWNVTLQRQLWRGGLAEAGYVASRGHNLIRARDGNQADASPAPLNLRPNPLVADVTLLESRARSRYDSLQLRFQQQSAGFSALASYVYGRAYDDASGFFSSAGDPSFPQDSRRPEAEWGRSSSDVRHRLSLGFVYDLPDTAGGGWLATGWQISGVVTLQSGRPFTVALFPELDNSNTGRAALGFGNNDRPNLIGDPTLASPSASRWFDTTAFTLPAYGTFGNAGRNIVDGPGFRNVNLALTKQVSLGATRLLLRLETFNVLNTANYDLPDNFFGSPTFGQILSAQAARRVQLGAKLAF